MSKPGCFTKDKDGEIVCCPYLKLEHSVLTNAGYQKVRWCIRFDKKVSQDIHINKSLDECEWGE